jgi:hypothetical protein
MTNSQCIDDDENCEIIFDTNADDKTIGDCNSEHSNVSHDTCDEKVDVMID